MNFFKKIIKKTFLYYPLKKASYFLNSWKMRRNIKKAEKDGVIGVSQGIIFEPTTKCNLNCRMCYQKNERMSGKKDLSLGEIKKIFSELKKKNNVKNVSLIGAEIFMRLDIFEIIEYFDGLGIKVYLATNGTLINENNIDKLKKLKNITGIGYSLDGFKEYHNKVRGNPFAFNKVIDAIKLTKDYFSVTVNTVVMDENIDQILKVANLVKEMGVINYSLQFEMFSTADEVEEAVRILDIDKNNFAVEIKEDSGYDFNLEKINGTVDNLKKIKGLRFLIQPESFNKYPEFYLDGSLRQKAKLYCKDINTLRINAQGEIIFCPFIKKSFGSLLKNTAENIWLSEEFKDFRVNLLKNNLTSVCKRCCRLGNR